MHTFPWLIPLLPLLGAAFNGLLGRRSGKLVVSLAALVTVGASVILTFMAFFAMRAAPGHRLEISGAPWLSVGSLNVPFGLVVDPLSGLMALVVAGIGFLIHLYSMGYMAEDPGYGRYFAYLNLFMFFMLTLVLADSLPLLFVGWEGVGLCSYLLIGFDYEKEVASAAGLKAFLTNRLGDLGLVLGMMALFAAFGTLSIGGILMQAGRLSVATAPGMITFATLMIFLAATGKSAQIPLYVWLPDAMAGPTPVSALIHAATMVASGVYLVCRLAPLFQLAPATLTVIAWVGGATALFAGLIALVQRDIKKVLAYSTVSQLGYMFMGLGAAGFAAGFFHLFTHAWFKALLFLGAGAVIHAVHEQDLLAMGGLRKRLPIAFWTMLVATACIIGVPFTSGFASKDEILYLAFLKSPWLWALGAAAAGCTGFYMLRLFTLAFLGESRAAGREAHPHADSRAMTSPLVILAVGALLAVFFGWPRAFGGAFRIEAFLAPALEFGRVPALPTEAGSPALAWLLAAVATVLGLGGAALGYATYRSGLKVAEEWAARFPRLHRLLLDKFYVDEAIEACVLAPVRWIGNLCWKLFDVILIDGVGVNLPGSLTRVSGDFAALAQTGRVRSYALAMVLGAAGLLWILLGGRL